VSDEERFRQQNRAMCEALAIAQARMHAAEQRCRTMTSVTSDAERLLMDLLLRSGPDRMRIEDRRVLIQVRERLQRIQRVK
jgi:hypothetical protein